MSQRVERIVVKPRHLHYDACHRLCSAARKLGNQAVYIQRQKIFAKEPCLNRAGLDQAVRSGNTELYRSMPSAASAQRQTQIVHEQFVSWRTAKTAYLADPSKFKAMPRLPGYSKKYRTFVVGRNGYKVADGHLILTDNNGVGFPPLKIRSCENQPFNAKYMVSSPFASVRGIFWVQLPLEGAPMRVLHPIRGEATPLNL